MSFAITDLLLNTGGQNPCYRSIVSNIEYYGECIVFVELELMQTEYFK